jgi:GLPGLI family protein
MKQIQSYFFIIFLLLSIHIEAQETKLIDVAKFKCTYQFEFLTDSIKMTYRDSDLYIVQIGENFTKSYCYQTFYIDSISSTPEGSNRQLDRLNNYIKNKPPNPDPSYWLGINDILSRGFFQFYVYKDYPKEKITVRDNISSNGFIYDDELKPQEWTILEDTMTVLDYSCQKAICSWRGRDWEAWFAPEIPLNEGPWKFYGLPGLIMKLKDTESHYSFDMVGLQQVNEPIHMTVSKNARTVNRLSFLRLKMKRTGTDLVAMDLAKAGISSAGSGELHYDYIELDYK